MGAPAEFTRAANVEHANLVAVFLSKQGHGATRNGVVKGHHLGLRGCVFKNLCVHTLFNFLNFRGRNRLIVRKVESSPLGIHQRALLLNMVAEHLAQGLVHKMGDRVISGSLFAAADINAGLNPIGKTQTAFNYLPDVTEDTGGDFLGVINTYQDA